MSKKSSNKLKLAISNGAKRLKDDQGRPLSDSQQVKQRQLAQRGIDAMQAAGVNTENPRNLNNKHQAAMFEQLDAEGVGERQQRNIAAAVRKISQEVYGNEKLSNSNQRFQEEKADSEYENPDSKAVNRENYEIAMESLRNDDHPHAERVAHCNDLADHFALRARETTRIDPINNWDRENDILHLTKGPKGGRYRSIPVETDAQRELLEKSCEYCRPNKDFPDRNVMFPEGMGDREWKSTRASLFEKHGFNEDSHTNMHALRHGRYAEMYEDRTHCPPPNEFPSRADFRDYAELVNGSEWRKIDRAARQEISNHAGHNRISVSNDYLGKS